MTDAFFALHAGLPRQSAGSDNTTRLLLDLARGHGLPREPRILDIGCGPGRAALTLAGETGGTVTALDTHRPYLDELAAAAHAQGLTEHIQPTERSMVDMPYPDGAFDLVWAEGSVYLIGFDVALHQWKRLLAPQGLLVLSECEWTTNSPSPAARAFWDQAYPLRTTAENVAAATAASYTVCATYLQPDSDWFTEYYGPLQERIDAAPVDDPEVSEATAATQVEIDLRREHGAEYGYTGYVLRPR